MIKIKKPNRGFYGLFFLKTTPWVQVAHDSKRHDNFEELHHRVLNMGYIIGETLPFDINKGMRRLGCTEAWSYCKPETLDKVYIIHVVGQNYSSDP